MQPAEVTAAPLQIGAPTRFTVGRALSQTLRVWSIDLPILLGVAILAYVPHFLVLTTLWLMEVAPSLWTMWLEGFLDRFMGYVAAGLVTPLVLDRLRGRFIARRRPVVIGLSRLGPIVRASISTSIHVAVQFAVLVIPGVIATVRWALVPPVSAAEPDAEVRDRSAALVAGHGWELFGVLLVLNAGLIGVGTLMGTFPSVRTFFPAIALLPGPLFLSFETVLRAVLYEQLRAEKEGVDVTQLAAVFE